MNPVDLLLLDALFLFEPKVHVQLSKSFAELFPSSLSEAMHSRIHGEATPSLRMQSLSRLARCGERGHETQLTQLLKVLLGVSGRDFENPGQHEMDSRLRESRFYHPSLFRRYFRLSLDAGDVSNTDVAKWSQLQIQPTLFFETLSSFEENGVALEALDRFLALPLEPVHEIEEFLSCLLDWWERRLIFSSNVNESINNEAALHNRMIRLYLRVLGTIDGSRRFEILSKCMKETRAVFAMVRLAQEESLRLLRKKENNYSDDFGLLTPEDEHSLCRQIRPRIAEHFSMQPATAKQIEIEAVFWAWDPLGDDQREIGAELLKSDGGVVTLLMATAGKHSPPTSTIGRKQFEDSIERFVPFTDLIKSVKLLGDKVAKFHPDAIAAAAKLERITTTNFLVL